MIGLAVEGERAAVQIFPLRDGRLIDRYGFHLENVDGQDTATLLEAFAIEYYGSAPSVPPQLVVPPDAGDTSALEQFLSDRRGSHVEVRAPVRGEKRRLQELATENARLALESEVVQAERKRLRRVEALEELREALNLESLPLRIECYDISNIQGESVVGSMVVFQDAMPKKAHYRKFGVRSLDGQDDFAALAEVVSRRFARLQDGAAAEDYDESFAATPNLVVIDGGKGQLAAALAAMQAYDLPRVAVIALAKREEEVFVPGQSDPIRARPRLAGPAPAAARPRRGAPLRARLPPPAPRREGARVDLRHAAGRRARRGGGRCCGTSARPSGFSPRARRNSRACPGSRSGPRARSTPSCTRQAGRSRRRRALPPRSRSSASAPSAPTSSATRSRPAAPGSRTSPRRCWSTGRRIRRCCSGCSTSRSSSRSCCSRPGPAAPPTAGTGARCCSSRQSVAVVLSGGLGLLACLDLAPTCGRDRRRGRARRGERVLGSRAAGDDHAARRRARGADRGRAQLDDVQPRPRDRPGERRALAVQYLGIPAAFGLNAVSYLIFIGALLFIGPQAPAAGRAHRSYLGASIGILRRRPQLRRLPADRGRGRLRLRPGEHARAGLGERLRAAGHGGRLHHRRLRRGRGHGGAGRRRPRRREPGAGCSRRC